MPEGKAVIQEGLTKFMADCSWVIYKNENSLRTSWSSKVAAIWSRYTLPQNSLWGTVKYQVGKNTCLLVNVNWIWMRKKKKKTPRSISYFPVTDRAGRRKKKIPSNSFTLSITLCLKQLCRVTRQQSRWFISKKTVI